jgi:hypothetical protein
MNILGRVIIRRRRNLWRSLICKECWMLWEQKVRELWVAQLNLKDKLAVSWRPNFPKGQTHIVINLECEQKEIRKIKLFLLNMRILATWIYWLNIEKLNLRLWTLMKDCKQDKKTPLEWQVHLILVDLIQMRLDLLKKSNGRMKLTNISLLLSNSQVNLYLFIKASKNQNFISKYL